MKKISLLSYNVQSIGVKVIIDAFLQYFNRDYEVTVAHAINDITIDSLVIPYGPKETYDALKHGYKVPISLMVDYHTLSLKNRSKFLLKNGYIFSKSLLLSILSYFYYFIKEHYIYTHCSNFMFVSQSDIDIVKLRFPNNNYLCVPNGVHLPRSFEKENKSNSEIVFGILSGWTEGTFLEARWFIDRYWPKMIKHNPNIRLRICGKFATDKMVNYFNCQPNIEFIGEVDSLDIFFNSIDVYVATKPIGCGILNKVLDAMAYKTLVIGISQSFTGFNYMKDSYVICNDVIDYIAFIDSYSDNKSQYNQYIDNAYANIQIYNNWTVNYTQFAKEIIAQKLLLIE